MRILCLAAFLAVFAAAVNSFAAPPKPENPKDHPDVVYRFPVLTAPRIARAPTIDGTVDKTEWADAAQSGPMVHWREQLAGTIGEQHHCYWVAYTDDALHIAWRFDRPPYALLPKSDAGVTPDTRAVWNDDKIEIMLRPGFGVSGQGYNLCINPKGAWADRYNFRMDWTGKWPTAARVTERGWEGELTMPFATLERQTPQPGEMWEILLLSNPITPANTILLNSFIHKWGLPSHGEYGYLCFGGADTPAVRVLDAGPIDAQNAAMTVEIVGAQSPAEVRIEAALHAGAEGTSGVQAEVTVHESGETVVPQKVDLNFFDACEQLTAQKTLAVLPPVASMDQTMMIQPGQTKQFPVRAKVPFGAHVFVWRVRDVKSGQIIGGGAAPFIQKPLFELAIENYLLIAKGLKVTADYARMTDVTDQCRIIGELIDPVTKNVVARKEESTAKGAGRLIFILPTPKQFDTTYELRAAVVGADGKALAEQTRTVELPQKPVWLDNTIGVTDDPLPGWTPIQLKGEDEASVVLRTYKLDASGLPASVTSRDKQLLTAPVALTIAGQTPAWERKLQSQSAGKVVWNSSAQHSGLKLSMRTTLEYDGLLVYDLTLDPQGKAIDVKELSLRIPYRKEFSWLRNASLGHDFTKGPLKSFDPVITVGDINTGLAFQCEWDKHWQIGALPVCSLDDGPNGQTLDWRINMIGQEGRQFSEPVTITFMLQAMPVRELDRSYHEQRHLYTNTPVVPPREGTIAELVDTDLRYALSGNTTVEAGSVAARVNLAWIGRYLLIGQGDDALGAAFTSAWWENHRAMFFLYDRENEPAVHEGKKPQTMYAKIHDVPWEDGWVDLALTWKKQDEQNVVLTFAVFNAAGKVQSAPAVLPWQRWQKIWSTPGELVIGGGKTVAVDQVLMSDQALEPQRLLEALRFDASQLSQPYTVVDSIDRIRFYRGKFITRPQRIKNGKGGVAGSMWWGALVRLVEGRPTRADLLRDRNTNRAVLLPSKQNDDEWDIGRWLNIRYVFPAFEQFHAMVGHYGQNHVHSPAVAREMYDTTAQRGVRNIMYTTFAAHPQLDKHISPFMAELMVKPKKVVYTAVYPSLATPAREYIAWQLKKSIDDYHIRVLHLDGTLEARVGDEDPLIDLGFVDEQGKTHPRYALFGNRDLAKRMRWLLHVYIPEVKGDPPGLALLGHGARSVPMITGFIDVTMSGEGGMFYGSDWSSLQQPETYPDISAYRMGVPHQTLTKGHGEHKFGPNFTFMYMRMVDGSLRHSGYAVQPSAWHIADDATDPDLIHQRIGDVKDRPYNPYFGKSGVGVMSNPVTLWWMLADDMNLKDATFVPFFESSQFITFTPDTLRGSLHYHQGNSALIVAANFTADDQPQAKIKIDLAKLGLAGKPLECFDAFTDDAYDLNADGAVTAAIPSKGYRLIRIEPR